LYVVGFWIVGVVYEVWIELWKNEFLVKNEFDFEFIMKWCYELMLKSVLIVLCVGTKGVSQNHLLSFDDNKVLKLSIGYAKHLFKCTGS